MHSYVIIAEREFHKHNNLEQSTAMAAYLKNKFTFIGIKTPERKVIQKQIIDKHGYPLLEEIEIVVKELWNLPFREFHHLAIDLIAKYKNKVPKTTIELYHYMLVNNSWWDTVDLIASNSVGTLISRFPSLINSHINQWSLDENIWLQRTAIIHQLKFKDKVNAQLLTKYIERSMGTKEFFLNKAIGWSLRQHSRVNPQWVMNFVNDHPGLSNLSQKEALRLILK